MNCSAQEKQLQPEQSHSEEGTGTGAVLNLTPRALANSSPGSALKPWGKDARLFCRNSEGVETVFGYRDATLSGFASSVNGARLPRVAKAHPGLELANAFSVKLKLHQHQGTLFSLSPRIDSQSGGSLPDLQANLA